MGSLNGLPALPMYAAGFGVQTPYATLLPPGANVAAFVRSTGVQSNDDPFVAKNLVTTLNAGLARCRSGLGDVVFVLPGHSESIATADAMSSLVAETKIIGVGSGSSIPTLRWTATAATFLLDVAGVTLAFLRLRMEGANGVVAPITVTAADCAIVGCDVEVASGAALKATTAITVGAGADRFSFVGNRVRGTATHNLTNGISVTAAVDSLLVQDCDMVFSATAANGLINVSAAATNMVFKRLSLYNTHTSSTATIAFGDVACDGVCEEVYSSIKNNGTSTTAGLTWGTAALVQANQCYTSDVRAVNGILSPVVGT